MVNIMEKFKLTGKVAMVIGGATGIGKAMAEALQAGQISLSLICNPILVKKQPQLYLHNQVLKPHH